MCVIFIIIDFLCVLQTSLDPLKLQKSLSWTLMPAPCFGIPHRRMVAAISPTILLRNVMSVRVTGSLCHHPALKPALE